MFGYEEELQYKLDKLIKKLKAIKKENEELKKILRQKLHLKKTKKKTNIIT